MITDQIRELLRARPFKSFGLSLSDGREINVLDPHAVAFADPNPAENEGLISIAHDEYFLIVNPAQIVSVGPAHPPKPPSREAVRKMREMIGLDPETGEEKGSN